MFEHSAAASRNCRRAANDRKMLSHRFFFGYAWDMFTHTPIYTHWQQLLSLMRRFRTAAFILRILTVVWTVLETGTLVIVATALFLVILPLAAALMLGILLTAWIESRRTNRRLSAEFAKKRICVLFFADEPERDEDGHTPFLSQNAQRLAAEGFCVVVLSPYLISAKGLRHGTFYCTARLEYENVYLIRRYYFFSLRKHVLSGKEVAYLF